VKLGASEIDNYQQANRALMSLLSINLLAGVATGMLQMTIPLYALSLKATTLQLGLIAGASGIGRLLVVIPSGLLIDRHGARQLFIVSTLLTAVAALVLISASSSTLLMVVLVILSMGQAVSFLALQAGFLKRLPFLGKARAGWQRGATQIGYYLIGPVLCGMLLQENHYAVVFSAASAIFIVELGISWFRQLSGAREVNDTPVTADSGQLARFKVLLADRVMQQVLIIECLGAATFMIFRAFVAPVAVAVLQLSVRDVTFLILSQGSVAMAMLLFGGGLLNLYPCARLYRISTVFVSLGALLLACANGFWVFWCGSVILGIGTGTMSLCSLSQIAKVSGEKGKIAALFSFSIGIGNTIGPVVAGLLGDVVTVQLSFITTIPIIFMSWLLFMPTGEPQRAGINPVYVGEQVE
jgi:MFS family permease